MMTDCGTAHSRIAARERVQSGDERMCSLGLVTRS